MSKGLRMRGADGRVFELGDGAVRLVEEAETPGRVPAQAVPHTASLTAGAYFAVMLESPAPSWRGAVRAVEESGTPRPAPAAAAFLAVTLESSARGWRGAAA